MLNKSNEKFTFSVPDIWEKLVPSKLVYNEIPVMIV